MWITAGSAPSLQSRAVSRWQSAVVVIYRVRIALSISLALSLLHSVSPCEGLCASGHVCVCLYTSYMYFCQFLVGVKPLYCLSSLSACKSLILCVPWTIMFWPAKLLWPGGVCKCTGSHPPFSLQPAAGTGLLLLLFMILINVGKMLFEEVDSLSKK